MVVGKEEENIWYKIDNIPTDTQLKEGDVKGIKEQKDL